MEIKTPIDIMKIAVKPNSNREEFYSMSSDNSLSHTRWNWKYHIVFIIIIITFSMLISLRFQPLPFEETYLLVECSPRYKTSLIPVSL